MRAEENKMSEMGGPALTQLVESLRQEVVCSIPDDLLRIFTELILPAALWPWS